MTRSLPRVGAAVAAVAAAVVLTGCQTDPGAAALVGSTAISTDRLASLTTEALKDPGAASRYTDRAAFARQELSQLVNARVVESAAARQGVTVSAAAVAQRVKEYAAQAGGMPQLQQQAAQVGVPPRELTDFVRTLVLSDALTDKLLAGKQVSDAQLRPLYQQNLDQFDQVHAAHILVKDKGLADRILAQVRANPGSFAALAKQYSIDTNSKDSGGDLSFAGRGQFVKPFSDAIFAAKPGSFLEVQTQFGWHVVHVIERKTTSFEQAKPDLQRQALSDLRQQALSAALTEEAKRLGVRINPRFGRWDADKRTVLPPAATVSSPSPTPQSSQSPPLGPQG